jgi:hypothetical protein
MVINRFLSVTNRQVLGLPVDYQSSISGPARIKAGLSKIYENL